VDGPLPGALNMARDHALALEHPEGEAVLRLYRWEAPTLSLGRNEPALGRYDPERLREAGVWVVRRPTGGRAVLHWRELTYSVVLPVATLGARSVYERINERLAGALVSLGVPAEIARAEGPSARPDAGPCFRRPASGEVVADGRKLVGSAQVRIGGGPHGVLLQHGSILIEDDQGLLDEPGARREEPAPATLRSLLGRPPAIEELEAALLEAFGAEAIENPRPLAAERELEERYGSHDWTWRR
jgi:lipoate-protein ligase A